jgi:hypothetical protein
MDLKVSKQMLLNVSCCFSPVFCSNSMSTLANFSCEVHHRQPQLHHAARMIHSTATIRHTRVRNGKKPTRHCDGSNSGPAVPSPLASAGCRSSDVSQSRNF